MSRDRHDFSWHLVALVLVIAGLGILAPLTWWETHGWDQPRKLSKRQARPAARPVAATPSDRPGPADRLAPAELSADAEPVIATLRPPIADEIRLDPSISETPALPSEPSPRINQELLATPRGELRLSATTARPSLPDLTGPSEYTPLRQPAEPPQPSLAAGSADDLPTTKAWPYPAGLYAQLHDTAAAAPTAANWANHVQRELDALVALQSLADPAATKSLARLRALAEEAKTLAAALNDEQARAKLLRAGFAIVRRLVIWDQVHLLAQRGPVRPPETVAVESWTHVWNDVDALLETTETGSNWRKYLLLDQAREQLESSSCSPGEQRQLARDMLYRLHSTQLSASQARFMKKAPLAALAARLKSKAAEAVDWKNLLQQIEQYELEDRTAHTQALSQHCEMLRWSCDDKEQELAETLTSYYRNANIRVAISDELANRLIPQQTPQLEPVGEVILGAWVTGQSQTNTKVRLVLTPDPQRWNIGLEALGEVASNTSSSKGPATFFQNGVSMFRARKRVTIDRDGMRVFTAEAQANANNNLNVFSTDFDGIPLLGGLARTIARNQYDNSRSAAKVEVEGRIIGRATTQLDDAVAKGLEKGKREVQAKLFTPLQRLHVEPTAVQLETTEDRLIARYRIAAREQLSAHTPRPQAPGDSLLSVQVHDTAFNNILEKLELKGRRVELRELYKELNDRFRSAPAEIPEDMPEGVYLTFADEDPVRLDCQDGRVRLTIRLKELAQGTRNRWSNFTVRGYYAPSADQLEANLVREGIIELIGDKGHIGIGDQIALRGIFAKVLSRNRKVHVINQQIAQAKELHDQQVTQFVIHDGWVGVALGPKAPGRQAAMHPKAELRSE